MSSRYSSVYTQSTFASKGRTSASLERKHPQSKQDLRVESCATSYQQSARREVGIVYQTQELDSEI